jgi:hypothetical protein
MVDVINVNYNVICNVYGGDPNVPLEGKECTCIYHCEESSCIHTNNLIFLAFQEDHIDLCRQWVQSLTRREVVMNHVRVEVFVQ